MRLRPRSPFVLTVAASASLAACGSSSPEHTANPPEVEAPPPTIEVAPPGDAVHGNPPEVLEVPPAGNPPPLLTSCPPNGPPEAGQPCSGDLRCHYGSTNPCDSSWTELRCVAGTFETSARPTCNPPPPMETSKR